MVTLSGDVLAAQSGAGRAGPAARRTFCYRPAASRAEILIESSADARTNPLRMEPQSWKNYNSESFRPNTPRVVIEYSYFCITQSAGGLSAGRGARAAEGRVLTTNNAVIEPADGRGRHNDINMCVDALERPSAWRIPRPRTPAPRSGRGTRATAECGSGKREGGGRAFDDGSIGVKLAGRRPHPDRSLAPNLTTPISYAIKYN
ncbi:hypothetical protein EVAR_25616_1 [Eumeta japonica]|uniref:Uncharacterized protein n=1 Tax=Eumeta variegata TaxID=151549 RepID=A0A4C1V0U0_EUMVA|nr:hypothetical protein EVAR_25616_1 [Eumeta japonica]